MAYAVAYPFGVVGIILTMLLIRKTFRVEPKKATAELGSAAEIDSQIPDYIDLEVTNPNCDGIALRNLPFMAESGIVFSRLLRNGRVIVPEDDSVIHVGDSLRLVGVKAKLSEFETVIGKKSRVNLKEIPNELATEHLHVTKREVLGKTLVEFSFGNYHGTVGTRINRAGIEFAANDSVHLQFGDSLTLVGPKEGVAKVAELLGSKAEALNKPHVLPLFVGFLLDSVLAGLHIPR